MNIEDPRIKLKEVLLSEIILYTRLLSVEEEKKVAMVDLDHGTLESAVRKEARLIDQIRHQEVRRCDGVLELCRLYGLDLRNTGLEEIAEAMDSQWREEFLNLRARLKEVTVDLGRSNDLNRMLCTQSLDHIRKTLHVLAGSGAVEKGVYGPPGRSSDTPQHPRQLFDLKV